MTFVDLLFYVFALFVTGAGVAVVASRNPVHSVLWLIFAFFNAAGLFVLLGAEMLAMLLVIVYVGAVAVQFLFVVMMLNIKTSSLKKGVQAYLPLGLLLAAVLLVEINMVILNPTAKIDVSKNDVLVESVIKADKKPGKTKTVKHEAKEVEKPVAEPLTEETPDKIEKQLSTTNAALIGSVLYTDYILYFQTSGLILLVAMIGAIVLTLRHREGVHRQKASVQNSRISSIKLMQVQTGKGID